MASAFKDHFSAVAGRYSEYRPHYPAELFDYLAGLVPADAVVWDCAAGSGQASVDLTARFAHVIATDASPEQISAASPHPHIEYRVAPAEESGIDDESVGMVTIAQALHWFDLDRFYAEVRRVLQPRGLVAAWSYGINVVEGEAVDQVAQNFYANILGPYWPPERRLVEAAYRTLPFPFAEIAAPAFKMETRWTLAQLLGYFGTWSATNRYTKATGQNPLPELATELAQVWGNPETRRHVTWPVGMRLGRRE